jgi:Ni/Co efflux regulator RcnB
MRKLILAIALAATVAPTAMVQADPPRRHDDRRDDHRNNGRYGKDDWRDGKRWDYNRPDPRYGNKYDAARYYRGGNYKERRLGRNDRVYRGNDGRYYCRRSDGTTGLVIGAVAGGVLGNVISNGNSSTLATILGAGAGGLLGRSIDRGDVKCK